MNWFIQDKTIGSLFEKDDYKAKYYVNLFPEENSSKNYRVVADIYATTEEVEYTTNDGDDRSESLRVYYIERAYFPNGGYITYENCSGQQDYSLIVNEKVRVEDDDGREWYVELTKMKARR